jgi:hypothetical protein
MITARRLRDSCYHGVLVRAADRRVDISIPHSAIFLHAVQYEVFNLSDVPVAPAHVNTRLEFCD